jgi:hypothetical protein
MDFIPNTNGIQSLANYSVTPLNAGATYTGTAEQNLANEAFVSVKTDQNGTLYAEFSIDGTNWDSSLSYSVTASTNEIHRFIKGARYIRIRFTNTSASNQTYFRLALFFGNFGPLTSSLNSVLSSDSDALTTRAITDETATAEGKFIGREIENKFGRNPDVDAAEDIWDGGGDYTGFPTSTLETVTVISSSTNDAAAGTGARTMRIFGLDGSFNQIQEDLILNGTSGVTSVNTYRRIYRAFVLTAGSGNYNAGTLTIRHTTTTANVFSVMPVATNIAQITSYTIPAGYTGYLKNIVITMLDTTANQAVIALWRRDFGGVPRITRPHAVSTTNLFNFVPYGGIRIAEKSDFVFRAISVLNTNADITISYDLLLVAN